MGICVKESGSDIDVFFGPAFGNLPPGALRKTAQSGLRYTREWIKAAQKAHIHVER
jgi:hypothetical protein